MMSKKSICLMPRRYALLVAGLLGIASSTIVARAADVEPTTVDRPLVEPPPPVAVAAAVDAESTKPEAPTQSTETSTVVPPPAGKILVPEESSPAPLPEDAPPPIIEVLETPLADCAAPCSEGLISKLSLENLAWKKGEYTIVPYGIGWLNAAYDSSRTTTGAFVLFVNSDSTDGESSFNLNARATRLGVDIGGPKIRQFNTGGKIEIDFHGLAETANRSGVLLRHAYGEFIIPNEWRILGGQTWDVISPLIPNTVNYSILWSGGNIGYRRPQLRVERYLDNDAGDRRITLQGSINQTIVADFVGRPELRGQDAGWPTVMGRAAFAMGERGGPVAPTELGFSGHIGQEIVDYLNPPVQLDRTYATWSLNVDLKAPINKHVGFQSEFFIGQTLGTFFGGISQEIDPVTREPIHSVGGWAEMWYYPDDKWRFHVGAGIDNPANGALSRTRRSQNTTCYANAFYYFTKLFSVGLELSYWETLYVGLEPGKDFRVETIMQYRF